MPENINDHVITVENISRLMTNTLGKIVNPIYTDVHRVGYFACFKIDNVLRFANKLDRILRLPEIKHDRDLQSSIALIGLNLWATIWMHRVYQLSHLTDDTEYQQTINQYRAQIYRFETVLAQNEKIQLETNVIQDWQRPSDQFRDDIDTIIYSAKNYQNRQIMNFTLIEFMNESSYKPNNAQYVEQITKVWVTIDILIHNYTVDNLNTREQNNGPIIKAFVKRIAPIIKTINENHKIFNYHDKEYIKAIDLQTLA